MTKTSTAPKPFLAKKQVSESDINRAEKFIGDNFPVIPNADECVIKHLWDTKFRLNYYAEKVEESKGAWNFQIYTSYDMVESYFVEIVEKENGEFEIINHTLIQREKRSKGVKL